MPRRVSLARAERLLRARKYAEVISSLEPQVFLYRENPVFYRVLGTACLYAGDYGGAGSYLRRALQLKPRAVPVLLGLAAVHLRRREVHDALRCWLDVLEVEPREKHAQRGLNLVKSTPDTADFVTMAESGRLRRLYPPLPVAFPRWLLPVVLGVAIVVAGSLFLPDVIRGWIVARTQPRSGTEELNISELPDTLAADTGDARYQLTSDEVEQIIERIGDLFNDYHDNLAMREANRILASNASALVKERVRHISTYFSQPTFQTFSDNYTYAEVVAEPWLYDGCYVRWSGRTTNVAEGGSRTTFQLLVGYENETVLEGIIDAETDVSFDFRANPIEVIGRLSYTDGQLLLTVTSIRRIRTGAG